MTASHSFGLADSGSPSYLSGSLTYIPLPLDMDLPPPPMAAALAQQPGL